MRRLGRATWFGWDMPSWPVVLLVLAALVPALCLVWLMNNAMQNERWAAREKLAQAYRAQLSFARDQFEARWKSHVAQIQALATNPPAQAFARAVESELVDTLLLFDQDGRMTYPDAPRSAGEVREVSAGWAEANQLEFLSRDYAQAAGKYDTLANSPNENLAARALQAQVRCLLQSGKKGTAIQVISDRLCSGDLDDAVDSEGRSIVANAELLALELIETRAEPLFEAVAQSLASRLNNYTNSVLAAPQRRFLMKALRALAPAISLPTLRAEELAATCADIAKAPASTEQMIATGLPDLWQFRLSNRVVALFTTSRLFRTIPGAGELPVVLLPPGRMDEGALATVPAGGLFPGWYLALSLPATPLAGGAPRISVYLWTGTTGLAAMILLAILAMRLTRRQLALARLKTDLAALVSHELRTPLSSMRVFVDTLLQDEEAQPIRTREYLRLIAAENERLSRLIEQFLCFSRLERKRSHFDFTAVPPREIAEKAAAALRPRLVAANCQFQVEVDPELPCVCADATALTTALINLLENAFKFSTGDKEVRLHARADHGDVIFSVQDNGPGISPREAKRIFRPFYQTDQRLARSNGGVGLGLSIVDQIVTAHGGRTVVESAPGRGASFSIILPSAAAN